MPNGQTVAVAYTFVMDATAQNGMQIDFWLSSALNRPTGYLLFCAPDMRATPGMRIGLNATPPPVEFYLYGVDFAENYYYHQGTYDNGTSPGSNTSGGVGQYGMHCIGPFANSGTNFAVRFYSQMFTGGVVRVWDRAGNPNRFSTFRGSWTDNQGNVTVLGVSHTGFVVNLGASSTDAPMFHWDAYADYWNN